MVCGGYFVPDDDTEIPTINRNDSESIDTLFLRRLPTDAVIYVQGSSAEYRMKIVGQYPRREVKIWKGDNPQCLIGPLNSILYWDDCMSYPGSLKVGRTGQFPNFGLTKSEGCTLRELVLDNVQTILLKTPNE